MGYFSLVSSSLITVWYFLYWARYHRYHCFTYIREKYINSFKTIRVDTVLIYPETFFQGFSSLLWSFNTQCSRVIHKQYAISCSKCTGTNHLQQHKAVLPTEVGQCIFHGNLLENQRLIKIEIKELTWPSNKRSGSSILEPKCKNIPIKPNNKLGCYK